MKTLSIKSFNSMFNKVFPVKPPKFKLQFNDEILMLQRENAQLLQELFDARRDANDLKCFELQFYELKKQLKELRESIEESKYL
jgi:hypothetical protein